MQTSHSSPSKGAGAPSRQPGIPPLEQGRFIEYHHNQRLPSRLYIPSLYRPEQAAPLLVMLHGCTQGAEEFAALTKMNRYAEQHGFLVLYPEQIRRANLKRCWNWFRPENQMRNEGEPLAIMEIVDDVRRHYHIDTDRIYVAGLSAGAAMAVILGATYPDIFAAVGLCAGVAYRAATSFSEALTAMRRGTVRSRSHGYAAYQAMGQYRRVVPLIVFHGTADSTVAPINAAQIVAQWAHANRFAAGGTTSSEPKLASTSDGMVSGGRSYTRRVYEGFDGDEMIEMYLVNGMGHCWPGGRDNSSYSDPQGPDASRLLIEFFSRHPIGRMVATARAIQRPVIPDVIPDVIPEPVPEPVAPREQPAHPTAPQPPAPHTGRWRRIRHTIGRIIAAIWHRLR
jgi:poly(hydroxyalkanoate) depolymerase family esterase